MILSSDRGRLSDARRSVLSELWTSRNLVKNLTLREIRGKYKRTALGQAWSLVNPIAQMLIYSLVFGFFLRFDPGRGEPSGLNIFALWLAAGLLPWLFFQAVLTTGMRSLLDNDNLIKKVYFPRHALVVSNVLASLFTSTIEMSVLAAAILILGGAPLLYLPATALFLIVLGVFGLGLGLVLSVVTVYFRDTQHLVNLLLSLWFYLTPVVYPISIVAEHDKKRPWLLDAYRMNPLTRFTEIFRDTLYNGRWPSLVSSLLVVVAAAVSVVVGARIFRRYEGRLAEEL